MAIKAKKIAALTTQITSNHTAKLLPENTVAARPETALIPPAKKRCLASIFCIDFINAFMLSFLLWGAIN